MMSIPGSSFFDRFSVSRRSSVGFALAALLLSLPAGAATRQWNGPTQALGNDGRIFEVQVGSYGSFFPDRDDKEPQLGVMVLDVRGPDGSERLIVPGTDTWRPERYPMVTYDHRSDALMVFWGTGGYGDDKWSLNLTTYQGGEWLDTAKVQIDGETALVQGMPHVAVTSDDFFLDLGADEVPFETRRTTFHVVWQNIEDGVVRYAPVPFLDGAYGGWNDTLSLAATSLKSHKGEGDVVDGSMVASTLPSSLVGALSLERAKEADAVALTLTDLDDGSLLTLHIEEVPMSLAHLAEQVRAHIEDTYNGSGPVELGPLAEAIRAEIIGLGARCHINPAISEFLGTEVGAWVETEGAGFEGSPAELAAAAWRHTLETGSAVYNKAVVRPDLQTDSIDLDGLSVAPTHLEKLNQLIRIRARGKFPAPENIGDGDATVLASDDGRSLLVAWLDAETGDLGYVENRGLGWSDPLSLGLGEDLSLETALDLLRRKIR